MTRVYVRSAAHTQSGDTLSHYRRILIIVVAAAMAAAMFVVASDRSAASASNTPREDSSQEDSIVFVDGRGRFDVWVDTVKGAGVDRLYFGDAGDVPLMGDWNCDGVDTPGVYRSSTGRVYLRDSLSSGPADRVYTFGAPRDIPLVGDFNGNGCDSVSLYRPSNGKVFLSNVLRAAPPATSFYFGNPGDAPFAGDFDGDGTDSIGLHRVSTGLVYFRNSNTAGFAEFQFMFGNPGDRMIAGDWNGNGIDTVAAYRPSNGVLYIKNTNRTGVADRSVAVGSYQWALTASGVPASAANTTSVTAPRFAPPSKTYKADVHVYPGDNLAKLARSKPAGTVFEIHGVLKGQSVTPKNGQVFFGSGDGVLDGRNQQRYAFSGSAADVVIQGLEIRNYKTPIQVGSIKSTGPRWIIENNNVHSSAGGGISVSDADGAVIRNNWIHNNDQLGIKVRRSKGTIVEGNEISFNNAQGKYNWGWEAGGTKFWDTEGLIVRNNYSHDNGGPGLWDDGNNYDILYEGNRVEDNDGPGIFHEIGYKATIRNNTIRRNGGNKGVWLWGAGILIASSRDTDVYNNIVEGNANGITLVQQSRGSGDRGKHLVQNNKVYNNKISGGKSGAITDTGSKAIYNSGNKFSNNTYTGNVKWAWNGSTKLDWAKWRKTGNDTNGTYKK